MDGILFLVKKTCGGRRTSFRAALALVIAFFFSFLAAAGALPLSETDMKDAPAKNDLSKEHASEHGEEGKLDPSRLILDHVMDGYSFHFFSYEGKEIGMDLPIIVYGSGRGWSVFSSARFKHGSAAYDGYALKEGKIVAVNEHGEIDENVSIIDLSITRNVMQLLLVNVLFIVLLLYVSFRYRTFMKKEKQNEGFAAPKGLHNAIETIIVFVRDEAAVPNLGAHAYRFLPFLLSIFFFILLNNLFGMLPGSANVTGNIAFTLTLSVVAFIVMLASASKNFWLHVIWPPGIPFLVKIILIPVEFIGIFVKPFALMIRLFANMLAGHIIILCLILTIFIMSNLHAAAGWGFSPISVLFMVFIYTIEILVAFIQAYIFTTLTAIFIGQMMHTQAEH